MTDPITLYGMKISMFTGKIRSYLIKQQMDFVERAPVDNHFNQVIKPQIGRQIIPVIEMPDGEIIQDSTDIIDYLEGQGLARESAYPKAPLARLLALIFELFGDEGLIRPAMHYRWNYEDRGGDFIRHGFGGFQGPDREAAINEKVERAIEKFSGFLPPLGINETSIPEIERAFEELIRVMDAHFERHPYILGSRPTIGDYGLMCSLYAHLGRDPVPASLMKNKAPNLYRWTERMNTPHDDLTDMPYYRPSDDLPESLGPVLDYIGRYFLPEMQVQVDKTNECLAMLGDIPSGQACTPTPSISAIAFGMFRHGDFDMQTVVRPIRLYMLQRVSDYYDTLPEAEQKRARDYLAPSGLDGLLTLKANRRVARKNHIEVWG